MGISLNIPQSIKKPHQEQLYLNIRSKLTGNKLENIGYTGQIAVTNVKTAHVLTTITKSVIKY
jgi:hypothetical protein